MYSKEEIEKALNLYHQVKSVSKVVHQLNDPSRRQLYTWIALEGKQKPKRKQLLTIHPPEHPRNPSVEVKLEAIKRCFEMGESVKSVSEDIGYNRATIYNWRKKYLKEGYWGLMNKKNIERGPLKEGTVNHRQDELSASAEELATIKAQMHDMQMEIDLLTETINILKKDPGIDQRALSNREKTVIIDALKNKYTLSQLLDRLKLPRSSYYYQKGRSNKPDRDQALRERIGILFKENKNCYGYRRIHALLKKEGTTRSEKVVRRILREEGLTVKIKKTASYCSYKGEITPEVSNIIDRNFHSDYPNQKWLTDITEFIIPAGKIYLSLIVDCFDGLLKTWRIGTRPNAELVNAMLDEAVVSLGQNQHPILHSDRGCHYRWPGWIERIKEYGLIRSMSKKGCSPDNAVCEGVFGRLKNEMFYHTNWAGVSIEEFIAQLDQYLQWYNSKRIKQSLGYMSPLEYRQNLGLA